MTAALPLSFVVGSFMVLCLDAANIENISISPKKALKKLPLFSRFEPNSGNYRNKATRFACCLFNFQFRIFGNDMRHLPELTTVDDAS